MQLIQFSLIPTGYSGHSKSSILRDIQAKAGSSLITLQGVVFSMVIVRVGLGISSERMTTQSRSTTFSGLGTGARRTDDSENTLNVVHLDNFKLGATKGELPA